MKRIVTIDAVTGNVLGEWSGGDEQELTLVAGRTYITLAAGDTASHSGQRWNGSSFELIPPAPVRVLSTIDFARRFQRAEETAIATLADSNRIVQALMRRLTLAQSVNLDHADVINGLAYLKSVGIPSVWADEQTADARIAAIRSSP